MKDKIRGNFPDKRLDELYKLIQQTIRSYCSENNLHYPTAVGVLEFVKKDLMEEDE